MTVHYVYLVFALLLLWLPRSWLRFGKQTVSKPARRYNVEIPERDPHDKSVQPLVEARKSRNWVDLLRGAVGGYALMSVAFEVTTREPGVGKKILLCQGVILLIGLMIQMVRYQKRLSLFAPIFYVQGLAFGMASALTGLLAMMGSWALTPVLPGAGAILFVQGALTLCFGMVLKQAGTMTLLLVAGITWLPMVVSVLAKKRLLVAFEKRTKVVPRASGEGEDWDAER